MATPTVDDFRAAITEELTTIEENLKQGGEGGLKDATYVQLGVEELAPHSLNPGLHGSWSSVAPSTAPRKRSSPGAPGERPTPLAGCHTYVPCIPCVYTYQPSYQATIAPLLTSNNAVSIQQNGRDGQPLVIIRFAALALSGENDFQQLLMHVLDVALKQADPTLNAGGRMCLLMDMKGMKQKGASQAMGDIVGMMKTYYPGRMEKVFLHRTPFWFSAVWAVVAATLPPIAKTIIEITSDSSLLPKLQALYDVAVVPSEYKGSAELRPLSAALACPA